MQAYFTAAMLTASILAIEAGKRGTVIYDDAPPAELIEGNSECNADLSQKIDDALSAALIPLQRSLDNKSPELWEKWFGEGTDESDTDVQSRMEEAMNYMRLRGESWDPLCCVNQLGACQGCKAGVLAYVTSWNYVGDN
jgi:hypothetical protein